MSLAENIQAKRKYYASLPFVAGGQSIDNRELAIQWIGLPDQCRLVMTIDAQLMMYATWKASDLITHTLPPAHIASNGEYPNDSLRRMGIWLPDWYPVGSNQVESASYNCKDFEQSFELLLSSPGHRAHMLATDAFYMAQIKVGAAWAYNTPPLSPGAWGTVGVFVSAPAQTNGEG